MIQDSACWENWSVIESEGYVIFNNWNTIFLSEVSLVGCSRSDDLAVVDRIIDGVRFGALHATLNTISDESALSNLVKHHCIHQFSVHISWRKLKDTMWMSWVCVLRVTIFPSQVHKSTEKNICTHWHVFSSATPTRIVFPSTIYVYWASIRHEILQPK